MVVLAVMPETAAFHRGTSRILLLIEHMGKPKKCVTIFKHLSSGGPKVGLTTNFRNYLAKSMIFGGQ
jgi:hypothetical protein